MSSVLAVSALQIFVFIITLCLWWWVHFASSGEACGTSCDWGRVAQANVLYLGVAGISFSATVAAAIIGYRTGRDLMWVPVVGTGLIVAGYLAAAALYNQAMTV